MKRSMILFVLLCLPSVARADSVTTFEDVGLPVNSFNNNAGPGGYLHSGGDSFNNDYSPSFGGIWKGWAFSTMTDTTTSGFTNQYSAITGSGSGGSLTYAVGFTFEEAGTGDPFHPAGSVVNLAGGTSPISIDVTNTTYAYQSMLTGDSVTHAFGPGDFFLLTIAGYDGVNGTGNQLGEVDFYLANFLGSNAYIVNTWQTIDLTSLAGAASLRFGLASTDNDPVFGMNTPAYFAADNLTTVPEPASWLLGMLAAAGYGLPRLRRRGNRDSSSAGV